MVDLKEREGDATFGSLGSWFCFKTRFFFLFPRVSFKKSCFRSVFVVVDMNELLFLKEKGGFLFQNRRRVLQLLLSMKAKRRKALENLKTGIF